MMSASSAQPPACRQARIEELSRYPRVNSRTTRLPAIHKTMVVSSNTERHAMSLERRDIAACGDERQ
jgi:hypothetical protein